MMIICNFYSSTKLLDCLRHWLGTWLIFYILLLVGNHTSKRCTAKIRGYPKHWCNSQMVHIEIPWYQYDCSHKMFGISGSPVHAFSKWTLQNVRVRSIQFPAVFDTEGETMQSRAKLVLSFSNMYYFLGLKIGQIVLRDKMAANFKS